MSETGDIHSTLYGNESPTGFDILAGRIREASDVKSAIPTGEAIRQQIMKAIERLRMETQGEKIIPKVPTTNLADEIARDMGRREGYRRDEDKKLRRIKEKPPDERLH